MPSRLDARHDFVRRFGIPERWREVSLGEIAEIVGGGTPSRDEGRYWQRGDIAWATPTDLTALDGKYLAATSERITTAGLHESAARLLPRGSVLYTSRATIGAKAIAAIDVATNQGFASFVPTDVNGEYLYYLLDLLTPIIKRLGAGTTFDEVSKRDIRKVRCGLPVSRDEQAAIAHVLDAVDAAIDRAREAESEARSLKQALVQDFFYAAIGVTAYADRPARDLPAGWSLAPTESLLASEPKNGISPKASSQPPGVPTFSIAAIRDGRVDLEDPSNLKYTDIPQRVVDRFRVHSGDVLVVRGNANPDLVGKSGRVGTYPESCIYPDITIRVAFRESGEGSVLPEYAVLAWNHPVVHNQVLRRAKTSNGTLKINGRDVRQIVMPVPPRAQQEEVVGLSTAIDSKASSLQAKRQALQQLKQSLMHDLLTGTVRVDPALLQEQQT